MSVGRDCERKFFSASLILIKQSAEALVLASALLYSGETLLVERVYVMSQKFCLS